MLWKLQFFPICKYHVFLSHCREDRDRLVHPLYETLQQQGIIPWLDRHDYPYGRTSLAALRDGILACRHAVFLITPDMLTQPRGWGIVELAWAELLQENVREAGGVLQNIVLPLFFLAQNDERLGRSAWQAIRERGAFYRPEDGDAVSWAARQIRGFLDREAALALGFANALAGDYRFRARLRARQGLIERITALHPPPVPPPVP